MEKISWTDRVRNEEILRRVKEEMNILHTIRGREAWSHLAWELPSKTRYCRKGRGKDRSDGKTRKKMLAATR